MTGPCGRACYRRSLNMPTLRTSVAVCFALLIVSKSFAMELTVDTYTSAMRKGGDDKAIVTVWLDGLFRGFEWANAAPNNSNGRLFCSPRKMGVQDEQVRSILDRYIETYHPGGSDWVAPHLLTALREVFPCH
jgi:hypothetical protein